MFSEIQGLTSVIFSLWLVTITIDGYRLPMSHKLRGYGLRLQELS